MAAIATLLLSTIALFTPQTAKASAIGDNCGASDGIYHGWLVAVSPDICEYDPQGNTFVVPAGVTSVDVMVIGAGGGGAGRPFISNYNELENRIFSGGGGGGEVTLCPGIDVTPGETLQAVSGVGGTHGNRGNFAGHAPYTKGRDGGDGTPSSLKRDTTELCGAEGGKGGKGGDDPDVAGWGGDSGSGFAGGHTGYAEMDLGVPHLYASSGGGGAASAGIAATVDGDTYTPGSGGHGISPSTLSAAAAGYFINDTKIYGTGGPGASIDPITYGPLWGANVDNQGEGYDSAWGSGGRGFSSYSGVSQVGSDGVVVFRYLNPVATKSVTITNGGTGSGTVTQGTITKNVGDTFTSVATADAGSVFAGWVCTPNTYDTTNATLTFTVSENVSCVATFNTAPQASTTFSAGAGSGTPPPNVSGPVTMPGIGDMIAPDGSSFGGWNCIWGEGSSGTFLEGDVFNPSGNDALCEAFWVSDEGPSAGPVTPPHTVTFDPNGGIGPRIGIGSNSPGKLRLNTFTKEDAIFDGWNTESNGSGIDYADGAFYDYGSDMTLYAQWINTSVPPVVKIKSKKLITTFAGDKPTLTPKMLKTITKWVKKLPTGAEIVCQGSTSNSKITAFDKWLANKRATNVCKYARSKRSDISFSIALNPSSANKVAARHVWMFYNY